MEWIYLSGYFITFFLMVRADYPERMKRLEMGYPQEVSFFWYAIYCVIWPWFYLMIILMILLYAFRNKGLFD